MGGTKGGYYVNFMRVVQRRDRAKDGLMWIREVSSYKSGLTFILPKVELILSLFLVLPKNTDKNHNG